MQSGKVEALCIQTDAKLFPQGVISSAEVTLEGFVNDVHAGFTRKSDSREKSLTRGTLTRNWRQWSAVSVEELAEVARIMQVENIAPWMLSANITLSGIPNLTQLPRGTQLIFAGGVILTVEAVNAPCVQPGKEIARVYPGKQPAQFVQAALNRRGLVGVVHRAGIINTGDMVTLGPPLG